MKLAKSVSLVIIEISKTEQSASGPIADHARGGRRGRSRSDVRKSWPSLSMLTRPATLLATVARPCTARNAALLPAHLARYAHSESLVVADRQPLSSPSSLHPLSFVSSREQGLPAYSRCSAYTALLALYLFRHPRQRRAASRHLPGDQRIISPSFPLTLRLPPYTAMTSVASFYDLKAEKPSGEKINFAVRFVPDFPSELPRFDSRLES